MPIHDDVQSVDGEAAARHIDAGTWVDTRDPEDGFTSECGTHAEIKGRDGEFDKLVETRSEINEILGVTS